MKKIYFLLLSLLAFSAFAQNYQYTIYNTSNSGILSNYIGDIKTDANGVLWISSYSGVSTFNGTTFTNYTVNNSGIASNAIKKIEIDGLSRKWMASESNGIIRYSGTTWTNYTTSNSGLPSNIINDIAVDGQNNLWVATPSGLTKFNGTTWTTYASLTDINSLATDSNNGVWVTNNNMMYKFNGTDFNLIDQGTYKILHIENNTIYASTGDGFLTYSTAGTFLNVQYPSNSCLSGYQYNDVDVDSANKVWVAFQGDGLQNFTNCYSYTTTNSGLPDNYISTVRTGTSGIVWAGTLQLGLVKMTPTASTCNAPSQFWNQNVTSTTATLNWAAAVPAPSSYVIRYNTTNVLGGIQDATTSTSLSLSNLTPNTDYHWWIASVCGEQQSSWTYGGFFYTPQATASCNAPTNTVIYNLGSTSCLIGWTAPSPAPSSGYEVYLGTSSVAPGVNTIPTYTSTVVNIDIPSGLSPATSYYCWIRSNCGGAKSAWSLVTNFVTNQLTGCTTAEHGLFPNTTFEPTCSGFNEIIVGNAWAGEYTNVVVNANHQYTFSSSFTTDIITITNDANVILASGPTPLSWFSGSTSGIIRYYLHANSICHSQNTNRTRYIQCATAAASCGVPSALAVSNITSNSCRLTWNAPTQVANSYDIFVSTTNTAPSVSTVATQTSNGTIVGSLNGLSASTTYYYWVRSNCNGTKSAWVSGGSFTTIAALNCNGAIYGLYPEATFTPACTGSVEQIAGNAWAGEYSNVNVTPNRQYTFSSSLATDYITITNALGTSVLASGTSPLVWNSNATTGVVRYHLSTNVNCGYQNTGRERFIQCTVSSSCGLPSNLAVSNITSNSCRLFWNSPTPSANSYDIYVNTSNTAPLATTNATQTSNVSIVGSLNGLSASTTYYYWVRSNCNGTKSAWVSGGSFTTIANLSCNGALYGLYPNDTFAPSCTGNFEQIVQNAWAGEYSNVNISSNKQYTFTSSVATDYITITNATGTVVLASGVTPLVWNSNTTSGVIRYHLNTNANCGAQDSSRIRSIKCATPSSCIAPTNFGSEVLSPTTAVIGWISSTSAPNGGYLYVYNTTQTIGGTDGNTFSTTADLTDLTPNTTYYWWVASNCVTSQSEWAYGGSFTTPATSGCNIPTQLYHDGLDSTSNNIGWVAPTPAPSNGYIYCYSTVNDPFSGGASIGTTTETFAVLSDLSPNTTYYFWVKSNCGNLQSNWVSGGSFTTHAVATTGCWQTVSAGMNHTMAIRTDGTLWGWGGNDFGQLGDGTSVTKTTPVQIGTASDWESVSAGTHYTMAIKSNGTLWGWGINDNSRLGEGTTITRIYPTQVSSATNWKSVCAGDVNTFAIKTDGTLWAWGYNGYAQLGDGTMNNKTTPYQVGTATNWKSIDVGTLHTIAVRTNGTLWAWGMNTYGQVGDGTTAVRYSPVQIGTETDWQSIAAGNNHSVALKTNGVLYTWGHNQWGQLGDNANVSTSSPNPVFDQVQNITAGSNYTAGTTAFGNMWYCGNNFFGPFGNGTTTNSNSIQVSNSNNHQMVVAGTDYTLSLRTDGSLSASGANGTGQLGIGSTINSSIFMSIACSPSLDVEEFTKAAMKFYPNPVNDILNISFEREITKVSIYNLLGQEVLTKTLNSNQITVDMSNLASGAYLVKANAGDVVKTEKIIKN